jgi:WD40-like Beta Propeller Repeat
MPRMSSVIGGGVLALALVLASPAFAAFPGTNGLLAVQPTAGRGIVLVTANGHVVRRVCTDRRLCGTPRRPRWSPNGQSLVFAGPGIRIVYIDGSCLDCQFGAAPNPAFGSDGTTISFIQRDRVTVDGIDTLRMRSPGVDGATDAVWSARGELAVVRRGAMWAGRPGRLRRIALADEPSWSPSGDRITAVQRGRVVIIGVRNGHVLRLAAGHAPAFSPDGRWIAFIAPGHRLMVVSSRGGRPRPVGHIRARSVDWQPRPRGRVPGCVAPRGSAVLATTPDAVVTRHGPAQPLISPFAPIAYMGCLRADGRERLLEHLHNNVDGVSWIASVDLAVPYAALVENTADEHYGGSNSVVQVFDLRTGEQRKDLGGEGALCAGPICAGIAQVVLGSDGVSAARTWGVAPLGSLSTPLRMDACASGGTVCLTQDGTGVLFTSNDPSTGAGSWSPSQITSPPGLPLWTVACPAQSLCVGVDGNVYTSSDPAGGAATWRPTALNGTSSNGVGISCPTTTLCVVTRLDGTIATSTDPTGGTVAWTVTQIDSAHPLNSVVCSAEPRCFITDSAGTVFTSGDPTGGQGVWTRSSVTPAFTSGACPTSTLCVTVGNGGIATTIAPDSAVWTRQPTPENLVSVSCPSSSLCVAVGPQGALYVSTDPASGAWTNTTIDYGLGLTSVSCASASLCVATDANGHVVTSTNPLGGASAWTPTLLEGDPCTDGHACSIESIQASDKSGLHTVDSSKLPGSGPFLSGLSLTGDTLSWSDNGSPRSATLTSP